MSKRSRTAEADDAKSGLAISEASAGAGVLGLLGFAGLFLLALVFFVAESYFLSMLLVSLALLVYVAGSEMGKLLVSGLTIFFSSKHLIRNATYLQETVVELRRVLAMRKDETGWVKVGPLEPGAKIRLPDNPLVRDIQVVLRREKGSEYTDYVAHQYYVDCRELYDHFHANLEFVAGVMPLFGLIGTVLGLIGMFDTLGANTSVENLSPQLALALKTTLYGAILASVYTVIASRFDQRIKALEYDYEIFSHALEVLVENKAVVEVQA
jgi:chemotaxis protein MotA